MEFIAMIAAHIGKCGVNVDPLEDLVKGKIMLGS